MTHFATDGVPSALRTKSMYQPGGVMLRFEGIVSRALVALTLESARSMLR